MTTRLGADSFSRPVEEEGREKGMLNEDWKINLMGVDKKRLGLWVRREVKRVKVRDYEALTEMRV